MGIDPASQNRSAYDQIAARFAERNAEMLPYLEDAASRLFHRLHSTERFQFPILDLGCGAGRDMAWMEARGACLIGADISTGMLLEARKRVRGSLFQLDMRHLCFRRELFAAVWCQAALLHLPKPFAVEALAEIRRVLLDQGLVYVSVQKGDSEGFEVRPYEPQERYYAHYQLPELTAVLQTAGFTLLDQGEAEARRPWIWALAVKQ
jgi:SAM-dependent methyltransferase